MELTPNGGKEVRETIMNKIENEEDDIIESGDVGGSGSGERSNPEPENNRTP